MKISKISPQIKNQDRVNIFIDDVYFCSLEIWQVVDLKIKVGQAIDDNFKADLLEASQFGKLYIKAVKYCLTRPHSEREVNDYLTKQQYKMEQRFDFKQQIIAKLKQANYLNDYNFAQWWVNNRNQRKGISFKKISQELSQKGVKKEIIDTLLLETDRDELVEIKKVIVKKSRRYKDEQKLIKYLYSQGFSFELIKKALRDDENLLF